MTGLEGLTGSTMTFESAESCSNFDLVFTDPSTSATCTADGAVAFVFHPPQNDIGTVGSGEGTFDVTCSDGTSCTGGGRDDPDRDGCSGPDEDRTRLGSETTDQRH